MLTAIETWNLSGRNMEIFPLHTFQIFLKFLKGKKEVYKESRSYMALILILHLYTLTTQIVLNSPRGRFANWDVATVTAGLQMETNDPTHFSRSP